MDLKSFISLIYEFTYPTLTDLRKLMKLSKAAKVAVSWLMSTLIALIVLFIIIMAFFWWELSPDTIRLEGQSAISEIAKRLPHVKNIFLPAYGLQYYNWPGETTQYYKYNAELNDFNQLLTDETFSRKEKCSLNQNVRGIEPPTWFYWPEDLKLEYVFLSYRLAAWYEESTKNTYIFYSSSQLLCN